MAGVKTTHADYDAYSQKWRRTRDVIAGQDAMRKAAECYLPKLKDESPDDYAARLKRSDYFNATWRTIDALSGMAFRKPPTVDVPAGIESYLEDVTMAGTSMEGLAKECVEEVLGPGRVGILVDHPRAPEKVAPLSVAAAQSLGLRPTLQLYTAESIRNWKFARIDNAWVLSLLVLGEKVAEPDPKDEFKDKVEDRYRVLDLVNGVYRQRLFKSDETGKDELLDEFFPLKNGKPLNRIPFVICGASGKNDSIDDPPLIDLTDKNVAHYQVNADYRHGLHFTGLPTPVVSGYVPEAEGEKFYIGSQSAWVFPDPNAKATFLEFTGTGLKSLSEALDRIEKQMALLGARMLADESKQAETLGATQIKRAGENSVLAKIVQSVSEAIEEALAIFADWAGQAGEIVYQINRDFLPAMMDAQQLSAIFAGVQSGNISKQEAFALLQRGDLIDGEVSYEEHQEQINSDPPEMPASPKPGEPAQAA